MKKDFLFGILFFGSLWGLSEAMLGGFLYGAGIRHSSAPLTVIGFIILTIAKSYLPQRYSATCMASVAMLYKFLNTPFFACHLLAIFLLGAGYDIVLNYFNIKSKAFFGIAATYTGYILFAFAITYVFRYRYWINEGLPKIANYVMTSGTMAAAGNLIAVPLSHAAGRRLKEGLINPFEFKSAPAAGGASLVVLAIWILGAARWF